MVNKEEIKRLKLAIFPPNQDSNLQCLCIAGVSGGEGCSSMAESLAIELSEYSEDKVLLLDGSLDHPVLHERFGLEKQYGLTDILAARCDPEDALRSTKIPNLSLMTVGSENLEFNHTINPHHLPGLIDELKSHFKYILIDAGAVFPHSFVLLLSAISDGVVLVVRPGFTRIVLARSAIREIKRTQANIVGVCFNRRRHWIPNWLYRRL